MDKLKPCPFCGGTDLHLKSFSGWVADVIVCYDCHATFSQQKITCEEDLIEAWNRRAMDSMKDLISRQAAIAEFSCCDLTPDGGIDANYAIDFLKELPSAQPDLSGYSSRLWKAAYERGKAEAQAEIVRCKDCKHRTSYWGNCKLLEEKYRSSVLVGGDDFCSRAERRTDEGD